MNNNWFLVVILLIILGIPIKISQLINYLIEKEIYINDIESIIEENKNNLKDNIKIFDIPYSIDK